MNDAEFVQIGTWLLPEAYGHDYDHFTNTKMATKPGQCIALYAKRDDLDGTPYAWMGPAIMTRFATRLLWACLGLLYGALAGLAWGWRTQQPEPPQGLTDVVVHKWVDEMRDAAQSN